MAKTLYEYCVEHSREELLRQWDEENNLPLRADQVRYGARNKVWWKCKRGHHWQAVIYARIMGNGCPYCAQRRVLPGFNDLETRFPEIAAQWDTKKNAPLMPQNILAYANRKVWWRCEEGHSYAALVTNRTSKHSDCPYCSNRLVLPGFNDLASRHPNVAKQWHPVLNVGLTPEQVTCGSRRNVWWECSHGHVWRARIYSRTAQRASGCPICAKWMASKAYRRQPPVELPDCMEVRHMEK